MKPLFLAPVARNDLLAIRTYIAKDDPAAAATQIRRLQRGLQHLAEYPQTGHRRPDLTPLPVLFWPVDNYLVVYRDQADVVEIVRILSRYRDITAVLEP